MFLIYFPVSGLDHERLGAYQLITRYSTCPVRLPERALLYMRLLGRLEGQVQHLGHLELGEIHQVRNRSPGLWSGPGWQW